MNQVDGPRDILDVDVDFNSEQMLAGLSDQEAAARIERYGFNELPSSRARSLIRIAFEVVREPMLLLLLACGSTYLLLGDVEEAIILLIFVVVVIAITLYQERKTERALEALRDLSSPRALVVRGGERKRIAGRDVVPGDLLVLSEGDRVPADGVVISTVNLTTDESLLTGESVPVRKQATPTDREMARPGGDDLPFVFSGTLVVRGAGLALARATGVQTELGKIGIDRLEHVMARRVGSKRQIAPFPWRQSQDRGNAGAVARAKISDRVSPTFAVETP